MSKSANVTVRVEPEVKAEAESILAQLGLPVSVVINSLYRQIILRGGVPFSMTIPARVPSRDTMNDEELGAMLRRGLSQAETGNMLPLKDVANELLQGK